MSLKKFWKFVNTSGKYNKVYEVSLWDAGEAASVAGRFVWQTTHSIVLLDADGREIHIDGMEFQDARELTALEQLAWADSEEIEHEPSKEV